jgi:phenylacetate-CoA ligase
MMHALCRDQSIMINEMFFNAKKDQLYKMISWSRERVPYYRTTWNLPQVSQQDFNFEFFTSQIPLLEKKELMQNPEAFLADGFQADQLDVEATSGTEGKPMLCYKTKEERLRCSMDLWSRRRSWCRTLSPESRFARFYAFRSLDRQSLITNTVLFKDNDILIPLFDMSEDKLAHYWDKIMEFQPQWMHGPSTAIFNIAKYVKDRSLPKPQIEFVELNGEYAPAEHLNLIRDAWGCKTANNYGCREFWTIAYSCPENRLHIVDSSIFIETLYNPDIDSNELVITSLRNLAWPLIRYRIGDIGEVSFIEDCPCRMKSHYCLELKRGRKADYFTLKNGQRINAIVFSGILRGLSSLDGRALIYQYQVLKRSDSWLEINLCIDKNMTRSPEEIIRIYDNELRKVIKPDITLDYQIVPQILPDPNTGKCRDFIDLSL